MNQEILAKVTQTLQTYNTKETISFKWIKDKINEVSGCNYSQSDVTNAIKQSDEFKNDIQSKGASINNKFYSKKPEVSKPTTQRYSSKNKQVAIERASRTQDTIPTLNE